MTANRSLMLTLVLATAAVAQSDGTGVVQVIERATGLAMSRAQVWLVDGPALEESDHGPGSRERWDVVTLARRWGVRLVPDQRGFVALPELRSRALLVAQHEDLWAAATVRRGFVPSRARLELIPDRPVAIRLQGDGRPLTAGFPIVAAFGGSAAPSLLNRWQAVTHGADHQVTLHHVVATLPELGAPLVDDTAEANPLFITVAGPFDPPLVAQVDVGRLEEPLVLQLPPLVTIRIELRDSSGALFRPLSEVWIESGDRVWPERGSYVASGMALLPVPPDGAIVTVHARPLDAAFEGVSAVVAVPHQGDSGDAGDLRVPLVYGTPGTAIEGRLVERGVRSHAGRRLVAILSARDGRDQLVHREELRVQRDGSFRFAVPPALRRRLDTELRIHFGDRSNNHDREATIPLAPLAPGARHDVGNVALAPRPVLAAGHVTDRDGTVVVGAHVACHVEGLLIEDVTDETGSFVLHGFSPVWLELTVESDDGAGRTYPFAPGDLGLAIALGDV